MGEPRRGNPGWAFRRGWDDGLSNRRLRSPERQPDRRLYRLGYVAGLRPGGGAGGPSPPTPAPPPPPPGPPAPRRWSG